MRDKQLERYSRHILLKEVGAKGQKKLLQSKVLVIGTGGLGAPAAIFLAAAGVGIIGLVDNDLVEFMEFRKIKLPNNPNCGVCGEHPTITELIDYEQAMCDLKAQGVGA